MSAWFWGLLELGKVAIAAAWRVELGRQAILSPNLRGLDVPALAHHIGRQRGALPYSPVRRSASLVARSNSAIACLTSRLSSARANAGSGVGRDDPCGVFLEAVLQAPLADRHRATAVIALRPATLRAGLDRGGGCEGCLSVHDPSSLMWAAS
jgi:hypothetical protein